MSQTISIAPAPFAANDDAGERSRLDADFDVRWAAWHARGRLHDRAVRGRFLIAAPAVVAAAAIVYRFLTR